MAIKKQATALKTYLEDVCDGKIIPDPNTQRSFGSMSNSVQDKLILTTMDNIYGYIPPIFLTSDGGVDNSELCINDGLHRTEALRYFYRNLRKLSPKLENSIISYDEVNRDENGNIILDENGKRTSIHKEFNIAGKYYKDLPRELQKRFDNFNIDVVIFENCNREKASELLQIYNDQAPMNTQQKAITRVHNFARIIKEITKNSYFFKNCGDYTKTDKDKNKLEYIICTSVMTSFFLDNWKKKANDNAKFLNENANIDQFNKIGEYMDRLSTFCENKFERFFNVKNTHLFIGLFHKFAQIGIDDSKFAVFLDNLEHELGNKTIDVNGEKTTFNKLDKENGTTGKKLIVAKMEVLESLMYDFFFEDSANALIHNVKADNTESDVLAFLRENVAEDITEQDAKDFADDLWCNDGVMDRTLRIESKLRDARNMISLVAIVAYCYRNDIDVEDWLADYANRNNCYLADQKRNYDVMVNDIKKYIAATA